jgi:2-dehydropantoate 2-reductase
VRDDIMQNKFENSRICVVGIGGVGGIIGGALARTYPHVTFYARGARKDAIRSKGLRIESEYLGDFIVNPELVTDDAQEIGIMDYIFICVKNYSLQQVCEAIQPMISKDTKIVPIMNGVDAADKTRKYLGKGTVLDALIYIASGSSENFTIVQKGNYSRVFIGLKDPSSEEKEAIEEVNNLLTGAGIECIVEADMEATIWKKYVLNCSFNILTAYYRANTKDLRADSSRVQEFRALLAEACQVGRKAGVKLPEAVEEEHMKHFLVNQSEDATSSLRRDMDAGRANELETFSGYILQLGKELGLVLPVTEYFYEKLSKGQRISN